MTTPNDVIKIAEAEVGYLEKSKAAYTADKNVLYDKKKGAGSDNYTKYGYEMHKMYPAVMDFPAYWCDAFVDWCFYKAYGIATAKSLLGGNFDDYTVNSAQMYKNKKAWYTKNPKVGDQIFFKNDTRICHTGIVYKVDASYVYTIEGNTSNSAEVVRNGGCVAKKKYALNYAKIAGYGRPPYDSYTTPATTPATATPTTPVKKGMGIDVSACQSSVDFKKVKAAGIEFVLLRSTTKDGNLDIKFEQYWKGATNAGLKIMGVYKLCYAQNTAQAIGEANRVIQALKGKKCDIWLDMEDFGGQQYYPKSTIAAIITAFLTTCVNAGYNVGIYCNYNWYNSYISEDIKKICRFWIARYPKNDTGVIHENLRPVGKGIIMWQYSSKGRIDGIPGDVDLDVKM